MIRKEYTDSRGRLFAVEVPTEDTPSSHGIPVGPPDLSFLKWPAEVELRLNHELYHRGILTLRDATHRTEELRAAMLAAWKADVSELLRAYTGDLPQ